MFLSDCFFCLLWPWLFMLEVFLRCLVITSYVSTFIAGTKKLLGPSVCVDVVSQLQTSLYSSSFQSVIPELVAAFLGPTSDLLDLEPWQSCFNKPSREFWGRLKFGNHRPTVIWLSLLIRKSLILVFSLLIGGLSMNVKFLEVEWAGVLGQDHNIHKRTY